MTPPTGYTHALYAGSGIVKVPERRVDGFVIPEAILGPGSLHIVSVGEAWESGNWTPCDADGKPTPEDQNPLPKPEAASDETPADPPADEPAAPSETPSAPPQRGKGGDR